jgi:hypothetical protein
MFNELSEAKEILARQIFLGYYFAFFNIGVVASAASYHQQLTTISR